LQRRLRRAEGMHVVQRSKLPIVEYDPHPRLFVVFRVLSIL
jgi:hypothetical protein